MPKIAKKIIIGVFWISVIYLVILTLVTLGAAEWFIGSRGSFMLLQSKHLMLKTWSHTGSSWMVYPKWGFFHDSSIKEMSSLSTWCWKLEVTLGAAEGFIPNVGSFMLLQSKHWMLKTWVLSSNYYYNWRSSKYRVRHPLVVTGKLPQYLTKHDKRGLYLNLDIPRSC